MAVKIGDTFRAAYADGNPLWKVTRRHAGTNAVIAVSQPEYFEIEGTRILGDYAGIEQAFTVKQVQAAKKWAKTINRLAEAQANFVANLKPGDIVHYNDGFNNFVRCEVVLGTPENVGGLNPSELIGQLVLQPIALVGEWRAHDLPHRRPDGQVELGYHAEKIVNRNGAWMANEGCIFESPGYSYGNRTNAIDPTELPAIDLSVPDMTPEQAEDAAAEQLRQKMIEALSDYRVDAREAIAAAINATRR